MMKERFATVVRRLGDGFAGVVHRYPIELLLMLCCCLVGFYARSVSSEGVVPQIFLIPLFALLALVVNTLTEGGRWRWLYYVCWLPMVPLALWGGLGTWFDTLSAGLTFLVLTPLAVLLCRRSVDNERFVADTVVWFQSVVLAGAFANIALGLFCAILFSAAYIFGCEGSWTGQVATYALIAVETLLVPTLFLMLYDDSRDKECLRSRVVDVIVNYILTPALLIYAVILALYILKIVFLWELPRGGVAYMVFAFALLAFAAQALQYLLNKRLYDWFFDRLGWVLLPVQLLFWAGVMRRVGEYGFTESRVMLVLCGGVMTLCVVLFLSRRTGRYFWVALSALVAFAAVAYLPALNPGRLAVQSQTARVTRIATELGVLDTAGRFEFDRLAVVDASQNEQLTQLNDALRYLDRNDEAALMRFGLQSQSDFTAHLPASYSEPDDESISYIRIVSHHTVRMTSLNEYRELITDFGLDSSDASYDFSDDSLRIVLGGDQPDFVISGRELLDGQLRRAGLAPVASERALNDVSDSLLRYDDQRLTILFSDIYLMRRDTTLVINNLSVGTVLLR